MYEILGHLPYVCLAARSNEETEMSKFHIIKNFDTASVIFQHMISYSTEQCHVEYGIYQFLGTSIGYKMDFSNFRTSMLKKNSRSLNILGKYDGLQQMTTVKRPPGNITMTRSIR